MNINEWMRFSVAAILFDLMMSDDESYINHAYCIFYMLNQIIKTTANKSQ